MNSRPGKVGDNMFRIVLIETDILVKQEHFSLLASKSPNCGSLMSPIKKNGSGNLIDQISKKTVHLGSDMWSPGQPNGQDLQQCIEYSTSTGHFNDQSCSSEECFICKWIREPVFVVRGLCKTSDVDEKYVLLPDVTYDDSLFFFGFGDYNIIYSKDMNSWLIVADRMDDLIKPDGSKEPSKIIGAFQPEKFGNQMPIGRHAWNLTTAECIGMVHLKLSGVGL